MPTAATNTTVNQAFFQALEGLVAKSLASKPCPEFSDNDYLRLGVQRVLESSESGRAFLQEHGVRFENIPELGNYFATLRRARRCAVLRDTNVTLVRTANQSLHDRRHEGTKMAVGHFYALNLRTHTLQHLVAGQGLHEHDMSALKKGQAQGASAGGAQRKARSHDLR